MLLKSEFEKTYAEFSTGVRTVTAVTAADVAVCATTVVLDLGLFQLSLFLCGLLPQNGDFNSGAEPLEGQVAVLRGNL